MRKFIIKCLLYVLAVPVTLVLAAVVYAALTGFSPYDRYQYFYTAVKTVRMLELDNDGGAASGVVIAPGRMLTAAHLFGGYDAWKVNDGDVKRTFTIEYIDPLTDVAVLSVPGIKCPCAPLARDTADQFSEVFILGYPLGARNPVLTDGRWQGQATDYADLVTAPATYGNSGGPVFILEDGMAKVIGLVSSGMLQPVQAGFSLIGVPTNYLTHISRTSIIKQAILCADGLDFDFCALGIPGDDVQ